MTIKMHSASWLAIKIRCLAGPEQLAVVGGILTNALAKEES